MTPRTPSVSWVFGAIDILTEFPYGHYIRLSASSRLGWSVPSLLRICVCAILEHQPVLNEPSV